MTVTRECGSCGLCCKLMIIEDLGKPANRWCQHYRQGAGCGIYESRPTECGTFVCGWLVNEALDERWKPNTARFFLWQPAGARRMIIEVDPAFPQAWRKEPYYSAIKAWSRRDRPGAGEIMVKVGDRVTMIFPERDIEMGVLQPDAMIKSGYAFVNGAYEPYARFE
jgi:hypothetical protein